ncbi:hypothetical protein HYDPIDRAFT_88888 [Hydnomerulius pinastri MD-312]|uniref:Uncharacterized protein n=1 Tax=Hydnomerulius pinastri MD-312 TaxID=994086 RepID=A0A0C9VHH6_9AGAM|nr:hypothetical protein HYDPIDRAFT_88888 [Hydnomerulius pinastri MD-312]
MVRCRLHDKQNSDSRRRCGKYYNTSQMPQSEAPAPGGQFPVPAVSQDPLLAFRCAPAIRPYLAEDATSPATVLIDSPVVYSEITGAKTIDLPSGSLSSAGALNVTVSLNGKVLANGAVQLNASAYEIPFSLEGITPQLAPYNLSCQATYSTSGSSSPQTFSSSATLYLLPNPTDGAATKMDLRTGALLAKPANGQGSDYQPVFPIGFYTEFEYLSGNLSVIDELSSQGYIHPIFETTPNPADLSNVFTRAGEKGMYVMYDMRYDYQNAASVTEQVNSNKNWTNLLTWYTGDEPDGSSDPQNATVSAYDLIYNLDGYHPVSLVLNCQDYYWSTYAAGADIVMQDVYMTGVNVSISVKFQTSCTPAYGDCGCDNCSPIPAGDTNSVPPNTLSGPVTANNGVGSYFDVSDRVSSFINRMEVMGWERTKAVWTVPQAFGGDPGDYWTRAPTGQEWVVATLMAVNHGALGVVPWIDPTPADIKASASSLALSLPKITPFLFNPASVRSNYVVGGVDVATWRTSNQTLVIAANTYYTSQSVNWGDITVDGSGAVSVFSSGDAGTTSSGFSLGSVGVGAFILSSA